MSRVDVAVEILSEHQPDYENFACRCGFLITSPADGRAQTPEAGFVRHQAEIVAAALDAAGFDG